MIKISKTALNKEIIFKGCKLKWAKSNSLLALAGIVIKACTMS